MAVKIRLSRQGAKKNPQLSRGRCDSAKKRDGAYLDKLGPYFPKAKTTQRQAQDRSRASRLGKPKAPRPTQTVGQLVKKLAK